MSETKMKRRLVGVVVSDKMDKSRVVVVESVKKHPVYGKYLNTRKKIMVHDENNHSKTGNTVLIEESTPVSKRKSWAFVKVIDNRK
jgi:small subunit ribosomal protein S17